MILCCALLSFVCQDPVPAAAPSNRALDVVELKNGDKLVGRVVSEIDGYVELQLEAGATVGLATSFIAEVRRGASPAPSAAPAQSPRSEWFVLYDAGGAAVGWLSSGVTPLPDGGYTVSEEYEFQDGPRRYRVTALATADSTNAAISTYFRERISEPLLATVQLPGVDQSAQTERIADERIVEASCRGDRLFVQRLDRHGRRERELAWSPNASFPLLARAIARQSPVGALTVFDPATEELVTRSYDGARRRSVVLDGERLQVTELAETTANGRNAEWLDAGMRTLRRELAGPALVAMPSNAESAPLAVGAARIDGALVPDASGTFGVWLPNPAWTVREADTEGQIVLACEAHGASVSLSRVDYLEAGTSLETAADAIVNWFALLHPDLRVTAREPVTVRDRPAVRLSASGRAAGATTSATVDVIPHQGTFLVLVCLARGTAWNELANDFEFVRRSVELEPQALAPTLQGPLADHARGKKHPPLRAVPSLPAAAHDKAAASKPAASKAASPKGTQRHKAAAKTSPERAPEPAPQPGPAAPTPPKKQPTVRIPSGG